MSVDTLTQPIDHRQYVAVKLIQTIDASCCPAVMSAPLGDDDAERLAGALRVLADPARLRLLSLISGTSAGESCVCDLTEPLGLSQPTVSHHLKVLHQAGLLDRDKRGSWVHYRLKTEQVGMLAEIFGAAPTAQPVAL